MRFIKVNELKLTQVELFSFFYYMCVAATASELFCMVYLANIKRFLYHSNLSCYIINFIYLLTRKLELMKINWREGAFFLGNESN